MCFYTEVAAWVNWELVKKSISASQGYELTETTVKKFTFSNLLYAV